KNRRRSRGFKRPPRNRQKAGFRRGYTGAAFLDRGEARLEKIFRFAKTGRSLRAVPSARPRDGAVPEAPPAFAPGAPHPWGECALGWAHGGELRLAAPHADGQACQERGAERGRLEVGGPCHTDAEEVRLQLHEQGARGGAPVDAELREPSAGVPFHGKG